ncbi:MAG TPA: GH116 family glycosyl hydrolase, partial [Gemmatimonadales bacterium]|nr:GH116 family glycosyl hydrolase [Gemmatimonadales bacterium]
MSWFRALAATLVLAFPLAAQTDRTQMPAGHIAAAVPRFDIAPSPISLVSDVRPGEFLSVTGPRSQWLGVETGQAELWVDPLKVAYGFQLNFRIPQYHDPIRGVDVASRVEIRPEMTTITYTHMTFTVKEHILAPRNEAGLLVLLEVNTFVPMEIEVQFHPVLQYMWPGAFGGQYAFWDDAHHGYILSESLQRHNAIIGTSWPARGEVNPAHMLSERPNTFVIPVDTARARKEFIPIAVAAGTEPRAEVFATYQGLLANALPLYRESRRWADTVLASSTSLDTPDDSLDLALAWAKIDLERQRVCNPDLGCGFVAGWGLSGTSSTRPGFGWFFGGDMAINSLAMDASGQWGPVAEALRFTAKYQRKDGKMPHEISQAAGRLPWFTDFPYPYYHADTTPFWMLALWEYWKASGDDATAKELWPNFKKAWEWCLSDETDGDGLIEEGGKAGYGAIEVGGLGENLHEDIYIAGVWIEALQATRELALHFRDRKLADKADKLRATALQTLNEKYWRPTEDQHAFGILVGGGTNDNLTAWPGTALSFDLLEPARAERTLRKLATDSISSDWGARLLSIGSPLYDPLHYNNGAVWPFMTGFVAWGQYRYRRPWSGYHLVDAVKQQVFDWSLGRNPENFSGAYYRPMDETVPDQFFATSMLVTPLLRGVLGWDPDAPDSSATLTPQLPPGWDTVRVHNLRVGATTLDVTLSRALGSVGAEVVSRTGPPVKLTVVLPIPLGAHDVYASVSGPSGTSMLKDSTGAPRVDVGAHDGSLPLPVTVPTGGRAALAAYWQGGLSVAAPTVDLVPGQSSTGVRVVDFVSDGGGWRLDLE